MPLRRVAAVACSQWWCLNGHPQGVHYTNTGCCSWRSESSLTLSAAMTIALLLALAGSLGLMAFIVKRLENS
jgi:hypothetical protein